MNKRKGVNMKRVLSLLLVFSLLLSLPGMGFAGTSNQQGYSVNDPIRYGKEMKFTDLKTKYGSWKNASIKITEVKLDNSGYVAAAKASGNKMDKDELDTNTYDFLKVKLMYTFSGFSGNTGSLIKDNLLAKSYFSEDTDSQIECKQVDKMFTGALYNRVNKYTAGGKVIQGDWFGKKIKDINLTGPATVTGYVYLPVDKGTKNNSLIGLELCPQQTKATSKVYFALSDQFSTSNIERTGNYTYGDYTVGFVHANFKMKEEAVEPDKEILVQKVYSIGSSSDPTIFLSLIKSTELEITDADLKKGLLETAQDIAKEKKIESSVDGNIYSVVGLTPDQSRYYSIHYIWKGTSYIEVWISGDASEKAAIEELWESYKASNVLSYSLDKELTLNTNRVYGNDLVGKFSSNVNFAEFTEEGYEDFEGKAFFKSQPFGQRVMLLKMVYYKRSTMILEESISEWIGKPAKRAEFDNSNVIILRDFSNKDKQYSVVMVRKDEKLYYLEFLYYDGFKNDDEKASIKSYLMNLGYSAMDAETFLADPIFK